MLSEEEGKKADRALELQRRTNLRDSLRVSLALLRFLMAGLVLSFLFPLRQSNLSPLSLSGILILIGLTIWLSEFFVERRVLRDPEGWALRLSPLARVAALLMKPILAIPVHLSARGGEPQQLVTITEAELKSFVDASQRQGVLEQDERQMIFSIFKFGDTLVREIMVPRIDIFALDVETPVQKAGDVLIESGYSRAPVYKDNIDHIMGLLYSKDMLKAWRGGQVNSLRELLRPAHFVPESKKLGELLAEMQSGRMHIAIVVDEYGGVAGLITLEDIVEEIVGEIQDEYDLGEEKSHQKIGVGEYIFHGGIPLDDFNEIMGSALSTEQADTLGGYMFSRMGHVPKVAERLEEDGLALTVEQISGRRIRRVRAMRLPVPNPPEKKKAHAK